MKTYTQPQNVPVYQILPGDCCTQEIKSSYDEQAETFLAKHGIKFRATLSDSKIPQWDGPYGHHYRVTFSRKIPSPRPTCDASLFKKDCIVFDFWGSKSDAEKRIHPSAYDILACISGEVSCPETFADYCANYGYDEDSIKALQVFRRCSSFAKRLREFFTPKEIEELSEIR